MVQTVYTIGHSTHSIDGFVELLKKHAIEAVADVRSIPMSRMNPHFNRDDLSASLARAGIKYVFLGGVLGARSTDACCYIGDKADYDLIAETRGFKEGIARVVEGSRRYRIALMCSEKEPLECHRTILVAKHVEAAGLEVAHILADGSLEPHRAAMQRLVRLLALPTPDMFHTEEDVISDAYRVQGDAIAYRRNSTDATSRKATAR